MAKFKNPTTGVEVEQENRSVQDLANQGFTEAVTTIQTPTVTQTATTSTVKPVEPQVIDRTATIEKINETIQNVGVDRPANEAFIQAAARAKFGRAASAEELQGVGTQFGLVGATTGDVMRRFGLEDEITDFGLQPPPEAIQAPVTTEKGEVVPTAQEQPKTAQERITELLGGFGQVLEGTKVQAREATQLAAKSEAIATAQSTINTLRTELANAGIADIQELEALADRPIPGSAIRIQQSDLSREQKLDAMITQQNYNNALVELQISQGNFQRAEQIVQETADDALQSFQFQLEALKAQGVIEEQEAARLEEQGQFERNLALEGFVALSPEQAQAFSPTELFTDPITGKSYLKPTGADLTPAEQELQELDILSKKLGIEAQMLKNQLIGDDSFQTTVTTGDGMFRVTYDKNGNEINRSRIGDSPAGTKQPSATQFEAAGFAARIEQAESMLNDLAGVGTGLGEAFGARNLPNLFKGENRKRFEQAERNFINSQLRRESGAAIADSEFESARLQYIPQPGDGEATLKQKADNRATVLNSLKLEAGNALPGATSQGGVTNTEDLFN